jgi:hypothetical protein
MSDQQELFRAPHEESRPKEVDPVQKTVTERTASPPVPPKKRSRVKGLDNAATYLQPRGCGGRVMLLDSIVLAVRFEDPFHDKGTYPIEMDFDEFASGDWGSADPLTVVSEYDRLAVLQPDGDEGNTIKDRCTYTHLHTRYRDLLKAARFKIDEELARLQTKGNQ